jgi:thiosulfate dehydrogenase [quinone] large subunit
MKNKGTFSTIQLTTLVLLRFLIGWHIFYEGLSKLLNPLWSSSGFLRESKWILSGFADWIITNSNVLDVVDFLNTWGLIAIGLGLILGLFARTAAVAGALLLLMYYLNSPPLIGIEYSLPAEGNYLIVNKTLIEAVALFALAIFPTSTMVGFDFYVEKLRKGKKQ